MTRLSFSFPLILLATGCGMVTEIAESEATGGAAGAAGSAGSSGSGGSAGSGGGGVSGSGGASGGSAGNAPIEVCGTLKGSALALPQNALIPTIQSDPVVLRQHGSNTYRVLFREKSTLDPSLTPGVQHSFTVPGSFAEWPQPNLVPEPISTPDSAKAVYAPSPEVPFAGLAYFDQGTFPETVVLREGASSLPVNSTESVPAFVRAGDESYLAGYSDPTRTQLSVSKAPIDGSKVLFNLQVGCATEPIFAEAVHHGGRYLVATTTSRPFNGCMLDVFADGPPTRIQVASIDEKGTNVTLVHEIQESTSIVAMHHVATPSGSWLIWQTGDSDCAPSVQAQRLDLQGKPVGSVQRVSADCEVSGAFGASAFGEGAAIAYFDFSKKSPTVVVRTIGSSSTDTTPPAYVHEATPSPNAALGAPALADAQDGMSLLVSWSAGGDADLQLLQVGCPIK